MENLKVLVEVSARHIHLSQQDLETLFGKGYTLTPKKDLSQPGQFACEERVKVCGAKGIFPSVSVLGPVRPDTQLEISLSDARVLGVLAPVRESGIIDKSAGIKLEGPFGSIDISQGVIAAKRHVHLTPKTAKEYGLNDKEIVRVSIKSERSLIFDDVVIRVRDDFANAMHVDADEANAAMISGEIFGEIIKV